MNIKKRKTKREEHNSKANNNIRKQKEHTINRKIIHCKKHQKYEINETTQTVMKRTMKNRNENNIK